jgi:hypothetical protein
MKETKLIKLIKPKLIKTKLIKLIKPKLIK